jgi:hypothetical protein
MVTEPAPQAEVDALIEACDVHLKYERKLDAAWRDGFRAGRQVGQDEGYAQAEADMAAAWHEFARPVARPEAHRREVADRAVRLAEASSRRDSAEHERSFVARAFATPAHMRTDVQKATVQSCPPPASGRNAA